MLQTTHGGSLRSKRIHKTVIDAFMIHFWHDSVCCAATEAYESNGDVDGAAWLFSASPSARAHTHTRTQKHCHLPLMAQWWRQHSLVNFWNRFRFSSILLSCCFSFCFPNSFFAVVQMCRSRVCAMAAIEINGNEHKNYMLLRGVNYEWSNQKASLHFSLQFCCTRTCLLRTSAFMRFSAGTDARCHRLVPQLRPSLPLLLPLLLAWCHCSVAVGVFKSLARSRFFDSIHFWYVIIIVIICE